MDDAQRLSLAARIVAGVELHLFGVAARDRRAILLEVGLAVVRLIREAEDDAAAGSPPRGAVR